MIHRRMEKEKRYLWSVYPLGSLAMAAASLLADPVLAQTIVITSKTPGATHPKPRQTNGNEKVFLMDPTRCRPPSPMATATTTGMTVEGRRLPHAEMKKTTEAKLRAGRACAATALSTTAR